MSLKYEPSSEPLHISAEHMLLQVKDRTKLFFFSVFLSSLELSDTTIYEPYIRALLGIAPHFC